jgi:hypothetical protein
MGWSSQIRISFIFAELTWNSIVDGAGEEDVIGGDFIAHAAG